MEESFSHTVSGCPCWRLGSQVDLDLSAGTAVGVEEMIGVRNRRTEMIQVFRTKFRLEFGRQMFKKEIFLVEYTQTEDGNRELYNLQIV